MDKIKAVQQIELIKDQVGRTKRLPGRANHMNDLTHLKDLVENYKNDGVFYAFLVNQAKKILTTHQEELDREKQIADLPNGGDLRVV